MVLCGDLECGCRGDFYTLEEDDGTLFTSPTVVAGHISATSWSASGKTLGTYFYRVRATNAVGDSGWSDAQSALVTPPAAPVLKRSPTRTVMVPMW